MATITVKDASFLDVAIEKPNANGRAAAAASRPIALSTEDKAAVDAIGNELAFRHPGGGCNMLSVDIPNWYVYPGSSVAANNGEGPRPGGQYHRATLGGASNQGIAVTGSIEGRTDGANFLLSFWAKGSGLLNVYIKTIDGSYAVNSFQQIASLPSGWKHYTFQYKSAIAKATTYTIQLYGQNNVTTTLDIADVQFEQSEWSAPSAYAPPSSNTVSARLVSPTPRTSVAMWGDSLTAGAGGFEPRTELGLQLNGSDIFNGGVGGETSTQIKTRMIAGNIANRYGVVVIWAGRNNYSDPDTVKADIETMIAAIPHGRFLVVSVTNQMTEVAGSTAYNYIVALNSDLKARYGRQFVDVRARLCQGSATDTPWPSLMYDATHMNAAGHGLVASEIHKAIVDNCFLSSHQEAALTDLQLRASPLQSVGLLGQVTAEFNRPADTTSYAANDAVTDSTSAPTVLTFTDLFRANGQSGYITRAKLVTSQATNVSQFRLHLYSVAPAAINDNSPQTFLYANRAGYLGNIDFDACQTEGTGSDAAFALWRQSLLVKADAASRTLYGVLETKLAFTPANGQSFSIELSLDRN